MPSPADREKALESALAQIDRQFGKGSVMRLGSDERAPVAVIPTDEELMMAEDCEKIILGES